MGEISIDTMQKSPFKYKTCFSREGAIFEKFIDLLDQHYTSDPSGDPDVVIYNESGFEHLRHRCKKIFITGENISPNHNQCDYSFSFADDSERNLCIPLFYYDGLFPALIEGKSNKIKALKTTPKTKFCNFVASNANSRERIKFVQQLMAYKAVDCYGKVLYNATGQWDIRSRRPKGNRKNSWQDIKIELIRAHKFTVAFENEASTNYITEKIVHPFLVGSIPIYWGADSVGDYFNHKCFINVNDFASFDEAIDFIIKVDNDDALYRSFFAEPLVSPNSRIHHLNDQRIISALKKVMEDDFVPVGKKRHIQHYCLYWLHWCYRLIYHDLLRLNSVKYWAYKVFGIQRWEYYSWNR